MNKWGRRIRGAIGLGLTWGFAWFAAGMILLVIVGPNAADVPFPLFFGLLGFLAGVTFAGILGLAEGRRRFDEMSIPRFALWGGVGGLVLATVMSVLLGGGVFPVLAPIFALAGAGCAAGSLALARVAENAQLSGAGRAELDDAETPERLGGGG
jgi:hypothetical protein